LQSAPRRRYEKVLCGTPIHVEEQGDGPVLLCLHGLGGGAHFFSVLGTALADGYRSIALDFPGAGFSPPLARFSFDMLADIVVQLMTSEGSPILCLLGHSMGTIIALEALRRSPDAASGLIAVGGLSNPLAGARSRIAKRVEQIRHSGMRGLGDDVAAANLCRATIESRPGLVALFSQLFELQSPEGYIATAEALASWTARPMPPLEGVRCLAVTGEHDLYAPPVAVREFARTLPSGTDVLVMPGAAHLPFLEQPTAFAALVRQFLGTLSDERAPT
jgi:pimeloyl-ACP methyl ester carboxylesterase